MSDTRRRAADPDGFDDIDDLVRRFDAGESWSKKRARSRAVETTPPAGATACVDWLLGVR